ncbi:MAG TPA: hypothetical protein VMH47_06010 [Gaiellaceae bacterium]|nr:hypothetical protein [Gaiellaceae bacterium]
MLLLAALPLYVAASGGRLAKAGEAIAALGVIVLLPGLVLRLPLVIPWAIGLSAAGYVVGREQHAAVDGWSSVVGAGLLLAAELAAWSIDHDRRIVSERTLVARDTLRLAALVAAAALLGFVLVGAAAVSSAAGLLLTAIGVVAAVSAVGVILRLARE